MRSAGLTTSVRRMPNFSFTTTTWPCATRVPFTYTSSGSPAARSSSTTDPWFSCSRLRIGIRVRPTSSDRVTGTSRITSRLMSCVIAGVCADISASAASSSATPALLAENSVLMDVVLLHDEAGEIHGLERLGVAVFGGNHLADHLERCGTQRFLAFWRGNLGDLLVAEQQQHVVADDGIQVLEHGDHRGVTRHDLHGNLQETRRGAGLEIHDEGRIEFHELRRQLHFGHGGRGRFVALAGKGVIRTTAAAKDQHGSD